MLFSQTILVAATSVAATATSVATIATTISAAIAATASTAAAAISATASSVAAIATTVSAAIATTTTAATISTAASSVAAATSSAIAVTTTIASTATAAAIATSTAASVVLGPSHVDLDLLAKDGGAVEGLGRLRGRVLVVVGDKGVAFAGVVGVGDSSELLELGLELGVGDTLVDSVDKELAALLSVGGHDDRNVGSLSLSQAKQVRRRGSRVSL